MKAGAEIGGKVTEAAGNTRIMIVRGHLRRDRFPNPCSVSLMLPPPQSAGIDSTPGSFATFVPSPNHLDTQSPGDPSPLSSPPTIDLKVLHVVNGEHFSGAERVQSHLGRCLPGFGVAADFACVKPGRFSEMLLEQDGRWGRGFALPMKHRADLRAAMGVCRLVRMHRYDLLHAHTPRTAMITAIAATMLGKPWVYHVHSPASRDSERRWSNQVNEWIERLSLRHCAHRITVSESLRSECIHGGAIPDSISVVHNGVPAVRPLRNTTPAPGGRWTIGMVALMRPRKGLEVAIDAISILLGKGHNIILRCIGPFETAAYQAEIESRIGRLGIESAIERQGFISDVPSALGKLDAMVLPSLYGEGLPMVVLEAMAAGLPVVATAVEGTPEAITPGVEGLLAKPRDPASLAHAIESLVNGNYNWHQMAEAAVDRHRRCFSDLAMAERTAAVYRRVLGL